ncbi:MAG: MATE family efflux transporter [Lachnospiraceae bacterium]
MNLSKMTRDMTEGSIAPKLLFFAFPIMFSSLFHLVYSLADSLVVGRFIGGNALAAVSVTGNATYLMFSISGGINMGSSVVLAQAYGARDQKKMKQVISTSIVVLGITAVLFTLIGMLTADLVLHIIQTPEEIYGMAKSYMMIIFAGTLGSVFYNWLASLLRAFGNSFVPLLCLIFSGILNVILDLAFVLGFGMGIEGAALATVLSQILSGSALLCLCLETVSRISSETGGMDPG